MVPPPGPSPSLSIQLVDQLIVPVSHLGTILVGDAAEIIPQIPDPGSHIAVVKIVDRVVDAASGTFGVRLELPNPDHALPGGVRCDIRFLDR